MILDKFKLQYEELKQPKKPIPTVKDSIVGFVLTGLISAVLIIVAVVVSR